MHCEKPPLFCNYWWCQEAVCHIGCPILALHQSLLDKEIAFTLRWKSSSILFFRNNLFFGCLVKSFKVKVVFIADRRVWFSCQYFFLIDRKATPQFGGIELGGGGSRIFFAPLLFLQFCLQLHNYTKILILKTSCLHCPSTLPSVPFIDPSSKQCFPLIWGRGKKQRWLLHQSLKPQNKKYHMIHIFLSINIQQNLTILMCGTFISEGGAWRWGGG